MYNLYNKEDGEKFIERINKLKPDTTPEWGKMDAAGMLFHLRQPLLIAFGEMKSKRMFIGVLFGGIVKKQMLADRPVKKNAPTDKRFIPVGNNDFEKEKEMLIASIRRIAEGGKESISKEPHPFFGNLSPEEWSTLTWKHFDHHLQQFGV